MASPQQQIAAGSPQMATRIDTLPLRTNAENTTDIDDPIIQNVLQEFENEMVQSKRVQQEHIQQSIIQQPQMSPPMMIPQQQQQQMQYYSHNYTQQNRQIQKKLLDTELLKKTGIISIIVFFLLNYNVMHLIISKMPDSASSYITGKEFIFNFIIIFGIFYVLLYFDFL